MVRLIYFSDALGMIHIEPEPPATANDSCHMSRDIVWLSGGGDEGDFCKISSFRMSEQNNSQIRNNPVLRPASKYRIVRVSYSSPGRQLCSKLSALIFWLIPESLLLLCWWFGWWTDPAWEVFGQIKPVVVVITTKFCRKCQRCCQGIGVKCKLSGWAANENFTIGVIFTTIIHDHLPS